MSAPTPVSDSELEGLRREFPMLPEEYFSHLHRVGWGEASSGRMIYRRPIDPREIYHAREFAECFLLLGDDTQGYCLALRLESLSLGELCPRGDWEEWSPSEKFESYVSGRKTA